VGRQRRRDYYWKNRQTALTWHKNYYRKHRKKFIKYAREHRNALRQWYEKEAERILAFEILGNKCAKCGETNQWYLQFDHIKPLLRGNANRPTSERTERIAHKIVTTGKSNGIQLLCANQHLEKTLKEFMNGDYRKTGKSGVP
jgi:5-methylcytosine-specific restriction endonuclease McrA